MRYRIVAVGRLSRSFLREGCVHYRARLARLAPCEVVEVRASRARQAAEVRAAEGASLLAAAEGRIVALDERGTRLTSVAMADRITRWESSGTSRTSLLIGGAEGLSEAVRAAASEVWRLSDLTLPHELTRLLLLEQLYRTESIRAGHPYHREG